MSTLLLTALLGVNTGHGAEHVKLPVLRIRRFLACRIRILPVTTDTLDYSHLEQNINQNHQIQA